MYTLLHKNISRHINLTDSEFELFTQKFRLDVFKKNERFLRAGKICRHTYFINKGMVRQYEIDDHGFEKNTMFAKEEWWVSDLYSFHSGKIGNQYLQSLEQTEVLILSKSDMEELFIKIPKLERFWRILHINAFISNQERVTLHLSKSAEERYLSFIKKYPDGEMRISQKNIASYLGISPEFLSTMKKRLKS